jgi:alkylation response protein AidB-like acyl-CoA dehydrogenase
MIKKIKSFMPKISDTERTALECGTISIDGDVFKGNRPKVTPILTSILSTQEQKFLDYTVPKLLELQKELGYGEDNTLHPTVMSYLKTHKFFSMIIPAEYGGLEFSPTAQSLVVTKIASAGYIGLAVTVMVPNSLGPGELLMHYGTQEQKDKYLPELASGSMIPCFGLTGVNNGSDATTHIDTATDNGDGTYSVTLNKRYITLAPIADLIGLAVKIDDAITLFLVERDHEGLIIGERHDPMGQPFMNGTIKGDIVLTDEHILGGKGNGWKMLVECLSVGRAISLPALGTAASIVSAVAAGSYAQTREQFGMPIAKMEGIQEPLAEIAYQAYVTNTTQNIINGELQKGESPSALSAMWKYQSTERGRIAINHAMDILAGAAIQEGPNNILANTYKSMPIAITVEGANILSRSLVTFGGGLMRSHPHLKNLVDAIQDEKTGAFCKHLSLMIGHTVGNFFKALTGNKYALFAFTSNMVLTLGAKYKRSEYISSRMADIFSIRIIETAVRSSIVAPELRSYVLKRLHNEELQAYREVQKELPFLSGLFVRLARQISLWGSKHISPEDNKIASDSITNKSNFVNTLLTKIHLSGRLKELVSTYTSDRNKSKVVEVDIKE